MAACINCGNQNPVGLSFCTSCGKPLVAPAPLPPAAVVGRTCPACGASVPEAVKFCIKCGKPLREAAHPPVAAPPPLGPPPPIAAALPPPPWRTPLVPSGRLDEMPDAPNPPAFMPPPSPPPGPHNSAVGMIVAVIVVLVVLGGVGYYGYTKWFANKAAPTPAAALLPQPLPTERVPQGGGQAALPPSVKSQPAHKSAAAAANPAQQSGKSGQTSAGSVSEERVPPRPAPSSGSGPAPVRHAPPAVVPAVPSGTSAPQDRGIRAGDNVQGAVLIRQIPPVYPTLAKQARISGVVRLRVIVGKDGAVKEATAISGHPFLRQAAIDAVRQWLYRPTLLNGEPTEVVTEVAITFNLGGS